MRHDHLHRFEIVQVTFLKKAAGVSDLTRASSGYKDDNDFNFYDCLQMRSLKSQIDVIIAIFHTWIMPLLITWSLMIAPSPAMFPSAQTA